MVQNLCFEDIGARNGIANALLCFCIFWKYADKYLHI